MIIINEIKELVHGRISLSQSLAEYTTFRIGGPADMFIEPQNEIELLALLRYLNRVNVHYLLLGNGSNVLISDDGYRGVIISMEYGFSSISVAKNIVKADAGIRLSKFVDYCINNNCKGYESLAGIPGTLGGAIIMNAGAYGSEISDTIIDVTIIRNYEIKTFAKQECNYEYRSSGLANDIVLSARFRTSTGSVEEMRRSRKELLIKRNMSQPTQHHNAGSIFKNPPGMYAAKLIEECNLKGYKAGNAEVSQLHANFIICKQQALATDVIDVINHVRKEVYTQRDVKLQLEIKLIGFNEDPVHSL